MSTYDSTSNSSSERYTWIKWYISQSDNEFFCEIDEDYIKDRFNLTGINDIIEDYQSYIPELFDEPTIQEDSEDYNSSNDLLPLLYGIIHSRYIMTPSGLVKMAEKYKNNEFGSCPRVYCCFQSLLPIGLSDIIGDSNVRVYCPRCNDVYSCGTIQESYLDGAFFGSGFPHMFFMTFPELRPKPPICEFEPRLYGFKISAKAREIQLKKAADARNRNKTSNGENAN